MKNILKRGLALLLIVMIIVSSISISSFAAVSRPQANTGIRDEVCTTFNGTTAPAYYTGSYSYANLSTLSASTLKSTLTTLMTSTHKDESTYANCRDYAYYTDCENGNTTYVTTLYTSHSATKSEWNTGWNREHVWPQSLGGGNTSGGGADLHHIRPSESGVNSSRGNKKYGETDNSNKVTSSKTGLLGGYSTSTYFEPLDNVKGDVARICLYVYVRWGSSWGADSVTEVFQSVDVLLEWCALDPVDTWEMERNDVIQGVQGNRNVFIDYPELAWKIFGKTVPSNLVSPSNGVENGTVSGGGNQGGNEGGSQGGNEGGTTPSCTHTNKTTVNASAATCNKAGYTGDVKCVSCGEIVTKGTSIPATNNHTEIIVNAKEATCLDGYSGDTKCSVCDTLLESGHILPADKGHTFDVWMEVTPATEEKSGIMSRHCFICGYGEVDTIPKIAKPQKTDNTPIIVVSIVTPVILLGVGTALFFIFKKKKS